MKGGRKRSTKGPGQMTNKGNQHPAKRIAYGLSNPSHDCQDVDFIITVDGTPQSVKNKLLALPNSPFVEQAQYYYYKDPQGNYIQTDITPAWQVCYPFVLLHRLIATTDMYSLSHRTSRPLRRGWEASRQAPSHTSRPLTSSSSKSTPVGCELKPTRKQSTPMMPKPCCRQ